MSWMRKWFSPRRPKLAPRTFRPCLESLEDRQLLNASSVFDGAGHRVTFVVDSTNTLTRYDRTGSHVITHNVLRAHGYRDINGGVGITIAFTNFTAVDVNHTGTHSLGSDIVDAAKAFDAHGHFVFDITNSMGSNFLTTEFTNAGSRTILSPGSVAVLVHPYPDRQGKIGRIVGFFDSVTTCTLVQVNSNGTTHTLAHDALADLTINPRSGSFILDVCTISSNQWTEITPSGSHVIANNVPI